MGFQALAQGGKVPFRDSKLTRMLEVVLCPGSSSNSGGPPSSPNLNSSVMLVNVSPAASIEKRTINSLRYGQMFAGTSAGGVGGGAGGGRSISSGGCKPTVQ